MTGPALQRVSTTAVTTSLLLVPPSLRVEPASLQSAYVGDDTVAYEVELAGDDSIDGLEVNAMSAKLAHQQHSPLQVPSRTFTLTIPFFARIQG